MTFAERLYELRKEKNLTLNDIANHLGVQRATIYKYEHGLITNIPPDKVHQLAKLFGVTRPYLMGWTDERNINPGFNLDMVAKKLREEENRAESKWKPSNNKDCITSATQALRALTKFKISRTPIYPHQIIQESALATMVTFGDEIQSETASQKSIAIIAEFKQKNGKPHYSFQVARDAPIGKTTLTLAVELGHIYLGHDANNITTEKELAAQCFAIHLLFPRPVIKILQERGFVFTERTFSMIFGYCDWCIDGILKAEPVVTSPELNRIVKEQFIPYMDMLQEIGMLSRFIYDTEEVLDMSRYMAGYEE